MDNITVMQECVVKVKKIPEEHFDISMNNEHDMLGQCSVRTEYSASESPMSEQNDSEEEELKPLAAVYIKTEVETDEETEEQDHLMGYPVADYEEWGEKKPVAESMLLRVKKEEGVEAEEDAGTSNERSEQVAFEEMKDEAEDSIGSNRGESPPEESEASGPENETVPTDTKRQPFACAHCPQTFRYKVTLKEHQQEHRGEHELFKCDTCQRQFTSQRSLWGHVGTHPTEEKTKYPCESCGKQFKDRRGLKEHLRVHTGETPYVCDHCGKRFKGGSSLRVHRRKHTGEQPYSCTICNRLFARKSNLVMHTRSHLNIKPYECKECGKTFAQSCNYTRHMRIHTKEMPYKCTVCSKTFARKGPLLSHMNVHTKEMPYTCSVCDAKFTHRDHCLNHEKLHSGRIQCIECGKRLSSKYNLKIHMHCHTGKKPYKCGYCDKTFALPETCKKHEMRHTKEYPYNCAECGKGYIDKRGLLRHMQSHGK